MSELWSVISEMKLYKNIVNLDSKYLTLQTLGKRYQ